MVQLHAGSDWLPKLTSQTFTSQLHVGRTEKWQKSFYLSFPVYFSLCPGLAFCRLHPSELLISDCCIRFQVTECFVERHHSRHRDQGQGQAGYPDWPSESGGDSSWWPPLCRQSWCHGEDRHQVWRESHTSSTSEWIGQSMWADICSWSISVWSASMAFVEKKIKKSFSFTSCYLKAL